MYAIRSYYEKMLKQKGDYQGQKEGLDISLYIINNDNLELKFSGANFPLYIVRDNELIILKQDRQPVAIHVIEKEFSTQTFQLQKNDRLYSFTDGFADQLGGVITSYSIHYTKLYELAAMTYALFIYSSLLLFLKRSTGPWKQSWYIWFCI